MAVRRSGAERVRVVSQRRVGFEKWRCGRHIAEIRKDLNGASETSDGDVVIGERGVAGDRDLPDDAVG
jgi:hypothetical protein